MKVNPFRPNSPVSPGMFVGRLEELSKLEQTLIQSRSGEPTHFMVTGERGIGKTSLLLYFKYLAHGDIPFNEEKFNFLILSLDVDANTTQFGLMRRVQTHLDHQLGHTEPARNFLKQAWNFIQRIRVMDTGIEKQMATETSDEILLDEFALSLAQVCNRTCQPDAQALFSAKYDGIVILIDEVDNCSPQLQLGSFLKLLLERLQRQGCDRLLIGLAGLPDLRSKLQLSHPSSLRIFEDIQLGRLTNVEVEQVIDICLEKANKENIEKTNITKEAKHVLINLSEGYPHFIQQFGYSAFVVDTNNLIEEEDVLKGALGSRGALDLIGDRYYRNDFYNRIQQDSYRQVLRIMADNLDGWINRAEIKAKFKGKDTTLSNALKALRDRHIIFSKEGIKGTYRLQHKGFALWIKLYGGTDLQPSLMKLSSQVSGATSSERQPVESTEE